ncbi:hypothetical protein [Mycolicibacterium psychrotolerans]|nr:hypothetical protein [Mycolicibacterium psychrotolerans]
MSAATRIGAFTALLAAVFAISLWVGHTVGPEAAAPVEVSHQHDGGRP